MDDSDQFYPYRDDRILIPTGNVLDSDRMPITVQLTAGQAELLRNLTAYSRRGFTWVSEYQDDGYLGPSNDDWDDLYPVIADLEDKLMGNDNTIFGVNTILTVLDYSNVIPSSDVYDIGPVPEGEIWIVHTLMWRTVGYACSQIIASVYNPFVGDIWIDREPSPVAGQSHFYDGNPITLTYGWILRIALYGTQQGDSKHIAATGYKMKQTG